MARKKLRAGVTAQYECKCACGHKSGLMGEEAAYDNKSNHLQQNPTHNPKVYIKLSLN
jgi:hypothetical protein